MDRTKGPPAAPRSRGVLSRFLHTAGVVVLGLAVGATLIEAGLRVYSRITPNVDVEFVRYARLMKAGAPGSAASFRHAPSTRARLMGVDVRIDERGLRDEAFPERPSLRIGLLGDSIAFGWGVPYGQRFSEVLEERWGAAHGAPVEIVNTGHGNYNTAQELAIFDDVLATEPLDGLVSVWYINDAEPTPPHRELPWYGRSHTAVFFWAKSDLLRRRFGASKSYANYYVDLYRPEAKGYDAFTSAIRSLGERARGRGIPWVFVVLPEFHDFSSGGPFEGVYAQVEALARESGALVVDAVAAFRDIDPAAIRVAYNDVHPNATGHAIIAETIVRAVDPGLFVRREPPLQESASP